MKITTIEDWLGADNKLGYDIWNKKYRYNNESFDNWLDRVSGNDLKLRDLIKQRKFLFGGRTLASRGTGNGQSYSNCYSSGYAPDSVEGMLELNKNLALTYKASGGQGLSLSLVRPKGAPVKGGKFVSDGIVPFMEIFNQTTASISQGGSRKGALMMSLSVWHPEIETFISIKDGTNKITKANLSVEIDDTFMSLVENGVTKYTYTNSLFGGAYVINPVELYDKIMNRAWSSAEPGVIFVDKFRNYNLMQNDNNYKIVTGNPCGEQPLPQNGACNLGSINLSEYVINPYSKDSYFDIESFACDINTYIKALDDVLEEGKEFHALPQQREMAENYRNIGLGVMGLATMFMKLGIVYGSKESKDITNDIMKNMFEYSLIASNLLAVERGCFPMYNKNILNSDILKNVNPSVLSIIKDGGLRNCSLLSIAPSGSISNTLNISGGLEPYYSLSYTRKTESLHGDKDVYYKIEVEPSKMAREAFGEYPCVSAMDIDWKDRVELQGIMQKYIDTAISSTVNVREDISVDELRDLYLYAWKNGIKGITIYREGSFEAIMSTKTNTDSTAPLSNDGKIKMRPVPDDTLYFPRKLIHGCGESKVMVGFSKLENRLVDVYIIGKSGSGCSKNISGQAVYISQILRLGGDLNDIQKAINGIDSCTSYIGAKIKGKNVSIGTNCPSGLLRLVQDTELEILAGEEFAKNKSVNKKNIENKKIICPECGEHLNPEGACWSCHSCGYSKCD